jgi:hypothetical protein
MEEKKKGSVEQEKVLAKKGTALPEKRKKERGGTALARRKELSPLALIAEAVRQHLPMETIERLMALHEKALAAQAKHEFFDALTRLQAKLPTIVNTKKVMNRKEKRADYGDVRFSYAPMEEIVDKVKGPIEEEGFSYTFKPHRSTTDGEQRWLIVPCVFHHKGGHEEISEFPSPIMSADERKILGLSEAQAVKAALTFGRRCSFISAVGIMTADPDDDNNSPETEGKDGQPRSTEESAEKAGEPATKEQLDALFEEVTKLIEAKATGPAQKRFIDTANKHYDAKRADLLTALRDSLRTIQKGGVHV